MLFPLLAAAALVFSPFVHAEKELSPAEGARRLDSLLSTLESARDFKVRIAAANQLGAIADGTVADWMLRAFRRERNNAVRLATLYAVGSIPDGRILPPLIELTNEEILSADELLAVERILWNYRAAVAVSDWARSLLDAMDTDERALSAYVLGLVGDASALPALAHALSDTSVTVRRRIFQALGRIGGERAAALCARAAKEEMNQTLKQTAGACLGETRLRQEAIPEERRRRIDLDLDLRELRPASVSPREVRAYRRRNVNPREIDRAVRSLQASPGAEREYKAVTIIASPSLRQTFRYDAQIETAASLASVDLSRFRERARQASDDVNRCYLDRLKTRPGLEGDVSFRFLILGKGEVAALDVLGGTLTDELVVDCIIGKIRALRFEPFPLNHVTMRYTYAFSPPKDVRYDYSGP